MQHSAAFNNIFIQSMHLPILSVLPVLQAEPHVNVPYYWQFGKIKLFIALGDKLLRLQYSYDGFAVFYLTVHNHFAESFQTDFLYV